MAKSKYKVVRILTIRILKNAKSQILIEYKVNLHNAQPQNQILNFISHWIFRFSCRFRQNYLK